MDGCYFIEDDMLTDEQKALVDECIYLRGRIITSYSQVKFILADISVILDLKFPYLISKRITAAKEIADRLGCKMLQSARGMINLIAGQRTRLRQLR